MARSLAAVVACMAVVACAGEPSSAPSPTSVEPVGVSPSEVETFVDPMPEPPELTLLPDGDNFEPVIREIFAFRDWLFAHPDQGNLVNEIFTPDCRCNRNLRGDLLDLRAEGQRILGRSAFDEITVRDVADGVRNLIIARRSRDLRLVSESGAVVSHLDESAPTRSLIRLLQQADGRWLADSIGRIVPR